MGIGWLYGWATNQRLTLLIGQLPENFPLRARLIKAVVIIAFTAGILLSPQLWINEGRLFPVLPLFDFLPILTFPLDSIALLIFCASSGAWIFYEKRVVGALAIGTLTVILLQDQMRWQPWVYLYLLMLLPFLLQSDSGDHEKTLLMVLQWIIAGVYVWSGINKLNPNFLDGTFYQLVHALGIEREFHTLKEVGYAIPIIELLTGFALLTRKFRKIGVYSAFAIHIFILLYLSLVVLNQNTIIYPWNVAMIFFVYILFLKGGEDDFRMAINELRSNIFLVAPIFLVWVLPFLNFFGYWDDYLSFSLYSNRPSRFYIAIQQKEIKMIDRQFENYFESIPGLRGGQLIAIDKWAFSELNVPFYPETRLFKKLSRKFCELGIPDDKLVFLELTYKKNAPQVKKFLCGDLNKSE